MCYNPKWFSSMMIENEMEEVIFLGTANIRQGV